MRERLRSDFDSMAALLFFNEIMCEHRNLFPINAMSLVVTNYQRTRCILRHAIDVRTFNFSEWVRQFLMIDQVKYYSEDFRKSMSKRGSFMGGPDHLIRKNRLMQCMYELGLQGIITMRWKHIAAVLDQRSEFDLMDDLLTPRNSRIISSILGFDPNHFNLIRTSEKNFMLGQVPPMTLVSRNDINGAHSAFRKRNFAG